MKHTAANHRDHQLFMLHHYRPRCARLSIGVRHGGVVVTDFNDPLHASMTAVLAGMVLARVVF